MSEPREVFQPEVIGQIMSSPEFLTPERLAVAKQLSQALTRDPALLASIERTLQTQGIDLDQIAPTPSELASFGWTEQDIAMPGARNAAAAAAAGAAAILVPVKV